MFFGIILKMSRGLECIYLIQSDSLNSNESYPQICSLLSKKCRVELPIISAYKKYAS